MCFNRPVPTQQLHLFTPAQPLLQRFGADFFRAVPPRPGVYIMSGEAERILYVGQSKNLRNRLGSYKNAKPDRAPRKIIRLVHSVRTIVWEECETAAAARLRENLLLRIHRPKFNVQNVYPRAYRFIGWRMDSGRMIFQIGASLPNAEKVFGAFKGGCVFAYAALLRLLWAALHQPTSPFDFPSCLLNSKPPGEYSFSSMRLSGWTEIIEAFWAGESNDLATRLSEALPTAGAVSPFQQTLHATDLEALAAFFEFGTRRNYLLRTQHGLGSSIIAQEQLDDLLVYKIDAQQKLLPEIASQF